MAQPQVLPQTLPPTGVRRMLCRVPVAVLWTSADAPRPQDDPVLAADARLSGWVQQMGPDDRLDLIHARRVDSQALYGEEVWVLPQARERDRLWPVLLPGQASARHPQGYPGWISAQQLADPPDGWALDGPACHGLARVRARHATLTQDSGRRLDVPLNTRLPLVRPGASPDAGDAPDLADSLRVLGPHGQAWLARHLVDTAAPGQDFPPGSAQQALALARELDGVPYLWGGLSPWGMDCSGLVRQIVGQQGLALPRDARDQIHRGRIVDPQAPHTWRAGDLVFFGEGGLSCPLDAVDHVGMLAEQAGGRWQLIHTQSTGQTQVGLAPLVGHLQTRLTAVRRLPWGAGG